MALPSRFGAFLVGVAVGGTQSLYWLYKDVENVSAAMTRKIAAVKLELDEKDRLAGLKLAAIEAAIAGSPAADQVASTLKSPPS